MVSIKSVRDTYQEPKRNPNKQAKRTTIIISQQFKVCNSVCLVCYSITGAFIIFSLVSKHFYTSLTALLTKVDRSVSRGDRNGREDDSMVGCVGGGCRDSALTVGSKGLACTDWVVAAGAGSVGVTSPVGFSMESSV